MKAEAELFELIKETKFEDYFKRVIKNTFAPFLFTYGLPADADLADIDKYHSGLKIDADQIAEIEKSAKLGFIVKVFKPVNLIAEYQKVLHRRAETFDFYHGYYSGRILHSSNINFMLSKVVHELNQNLQSPATLLENIFAGDTQEVDLIKLAEVWAFCDLYTEFYEMLQSYQAGNFQTGFSIDKNLNLRNIFDQLSSGGFIQCDYSNFQAAFSPSPLPVTFVRVRWIKQNLRGKNTAKKALIDMLRLMGVPADQITDKKRLEACFADADGQPLIFTGSNFYNNNDYRHHSEYYPELQKIIG
jgi:hypothetical protein